VSPETIVVEERNASRIFFARIMPKKEGPEKILSQNAPR
jgi:hypothetical protein